MHNVGWCTFIASVCNKSQELFAFFSHSFLRYHFFAALLYEGFVQGIRVVRDRTVARRIEVLGHRDRMMDFQELADEAFSDLLAKHERPVGLEAALEQSARSTAGKRSQGARRTTLFS